MKKQIKPSKYLQLLILVFGVFMILPTVTLAQENTREQIEGGIRYIDYEIKRLTYKREAIGLEFEAISNFSMNVRPILAGYNDIAEKIQLKQSEIASYGYSFSEKGMQLEEELKSLKSQRDKYLTQFRNSRGVTSLNWVQCNTIEELQNEYTRTVEYYQDQKKKYDNLALELGNLNNEKQNLTAELNFMGGVGGRIQDLQGCWLLRTGKYTSTITVTTTDLKEFVGHLTVNNLHNYFDNQMMFRVTRVSPDTFRGTEITFKETSPGNYKGVNIPMKITINSDGHFLTWTSDETVTMQRCN